jgi:hypothetical protein
MTLEKTTPIIPVMQLKRKFLCTHFKPSQVYFFLYSDKEEVQNSAVFSGKNNGTRR